MQVSTEQIVPHVHQMRRLWIVGLVWTALFVEYFGTRENVADWRGCRALLRPTFTGILSVWLVPTSSAATKGGAM